MFDRAIKTNVDETFREVTVGSTSHFEPLGLDVSVAVGYLSNLVTAYTEVYTRLASPVSTPDTFRQGASPPVDRRGSTCSISISQ